MLVFARDEKNSLLISLLLGNWGSPNGNSSRIRRFNRIVPAPFDRRRRVAYDQGTQSFGRILCSVNLECLSFWFFWSSPFSSSDQASSPTSAKAWAKGSVISKARSRKARTVPQRTVRRSSFSLVMPSYLWSIIHG